MAESGRLPRPRRLRRLRNRRALKRRPLCPAQPRMCERKPRLLRKYVVVIVGLVSTVLTPAARWRPISPIRQEVTLVRVQSDQAETAAVRIEDFIREIVTAIAWTARSATCTRRGPRQRYLDYLWLLRQTPPSPRRCISTLRAETLLVSRLARHVVGSGADHSQDPASWPPRPVRGTSAGLFPRSRALHDHRAAAERSRRGGRGGGGEPEVLWGVISQMQIGRPGSLTSWIPEASSSPIRTSASSCRRPRWRPSAGACGPCRRAPPVGGETSEATIAQIWTDARC